MKKLKNVLPFLLLITGLQGFSQDEIPVDPILIRLQGRIVSVEDSSAVPYANIINNRTHSGTLTDADGYFSIEMLNIDSLIATSLGYQPKVLKVPYNYSQQTVLVFPMEPVNYQLREVTVQGQSNSIDLGLGTGTPPDIAPELRGNAFNENPPILAALFNPISFWQYYLGKQERHKREVRRVIATEEEWQRFSQYYNKEKVMELTGLNRMDADSFMIWFNSQDVLPYTSNEFEIITAINQYFLLYKLEGNLD